MSFQTVELTREGAIATLALNRPDALNSLNALMIRELGECLASIRDDSSIRCLLVTGSGKAFAVGADIKEMSERGPETGRTMSEEGQRVFQSLEDLPFATIAVVNGFALGGGLELALACDFIVASEKAKMGTPEVSLGLICGYGGTQRLSRIVGRSRARLITLTGDVYTAEQMEKWGVVALTFEPAELMGQAKKIAQKIAERSPRAIRFTKEAIRRGVELPQTEGLKLEAELFGQVFRSDDKREGIAAFLEKRAPQFTGR